jgi:hypothetical protein
MVGATPRAVNANRGTLASWFLVGFRLRAPSLWSQSGHGGRPPNRRDPSRPAAHSCPRVAPRGHPIWQKSGSPATENVSLLSPTRYNEPGSKHRKSPTRDPFARSAQASVPLIDPKILISLCRSDNFWPFDRFAGKCSGGHVPQTIDSHSVSVSLSTFGV